MKQIKQLSFVGLAIMLVLASCSIEKRHYMSGYNVEWKNAKYHPDKQGFTNKNNFNKADNPKIKKAEDLVNNIKTNKNTTTVYDETVTASTDNYFIPKSGKIILSKKDLNKMMANTSSNKKDNLSVNATPIKDKGKLLSKLSKTSPDADDGSGALRGIGWVVLILGLLILLFASILIGALLMLLGLIFVISGKSNEDTSPKSNNKPENPQYIDVVYLKNGGIIRGIIIEQTPSVQIKIQTKDGSVFVYKMEEIEKMTKELSK